MQKGQYFVMAFVKSFFLWGASGDYWAKEHTLKNAALWKRSKLIWTNTNKT